MYHWICAFFSFHCWWSSLRTIKFWKALLTHKLSDTHSVTSFILHHIYKNITKYDTQHRSGTKVGKLFLYYIGCTFTYISLTSFFSSFDFFQLNVRLLLGSLTDTDSGNNSDGEGSPLIFCKLFGQYMPGRLIAVFNVELMISGAISDSKWFQKK